MGKKRAPRHQAGTAALLALDAAGIPHELHTFDPGSDHFGQHAADALAELKVGPEVILKTLIVDLTAGKGPKRSLGVCCVPVTGNLSLKKAAQAFGVPKISMADPKDASTSSGYIPGGISPIGQKNPLPTLIDSSVEHTPTVFVSGGKRGLDIALAPTSLVSITHATFADIAG